MECKCCRGNGHVTMKVKDLGGRDHYNRYRLTIAVCPSCLGRGYNIVSDTQRSQSVEQYNQIVD